MYKVCIEECGYIEYIKDSDLPDEPTLLISSCPDCGYYALEWSDSYFLNKKAGILNMKAESDAYQME